MDWSVLVIAGVVVVTFIVLKRLSFVSPEIARKHLATGALVIDVRSPKEFAEGHVPNAINIPLGELQTRLPRQATDKNRPLLLHCLSGGRSAIAAQRARTLGYTKVFNLGSYRRAERIVTKK